MKSLKVADIIHGALRRFTDGLGQLWCSLADYYIRGGHFEKARDVYEEAIQTVMTVRDFGEVTLYLHKVLKPTPNPYFQQPDHSLYGFLVYSFASNKLNVNDL